VVITANFTKRLPATPCSTVAANRGPAFRALSHGAIATRRTYVAVTSHVLDLAKGIHRSRGLVRLLQLSKQFTDAFTSPFKFLKFRWGWVALLEKLRLSSYESAQFDADLGFVVGHNSPHANSHECHPGTGSLWRSRSNSLSRPSIWEYFGFLILNQVVRSRSVVQGPKLCLATGFLRLECHAESLSGRIAKGGRTPC
jgi:hypothetical protein